MKILPIVLAILSLASSAPAPHKRDHFPDETESEVCLLCSPCIAVAVVAVTAVQCAFAVVEGVLCCPLRCCAAMLDPPSPHRRIKPQRRTEPPRFALSPPKVAVDAHLQDNTQEQSLQDNGQEQSLQDNAQEQSFEAKVPTVQEEVIPSIGSTFEPARL